MDIIKVISKELGIQAWQTEAVIKLIDEGNTIPFIARYRKEATGSLNDEQLRAFDERLTYLRNLEDKKTQVLSAIESQGKLTEELRAKIEAADTQVGVEDLYRPFRPKRRTRAMIAKEKGLEPLAELILAQKIKKPLAEIASQYLVEEKGVLSAEEAIDGAKDIIAEYIADQAQFRRDIRRMSMNEGMITTKAKDEKAESVYENYYDYTEAARNIPGHRILAINRGEKEKFITVKLDVPENEALTYLRKRIILGINHETEPVLIEAIEDGYKRLIAPAIEREIRNELTEKAEDTGIKNFGKNLEQLLMQPPVAGRVVLGWDPAFRTGCKLAVVDQTGKVLDTCVIYPTLPQKKIRESLDILKKLISKYKITLISLGNGTASRESEAVIVDLIKSLDTKVEYVIVNEAGASVYSASKLATEEFPAFDVGQRSAASMARRLQDPLAELVKIDPKALGVGQYQHDMNQKKLGEALSGTVESCVNKVGVDVNTASVALLEYVAGINKTIAKNIVAYREENGGFKNRRQLLKVPKLGPKAYEQCAGFLRIRGGDQPLDATGVHPETYKAVQQLVAALGLSQEALLHGGIKDVGRQIKDYRAMAAELGIGEPTLRDIVAELEKPGRDPREAMPKPVLRTDILEMKDLEEGMILKGTVRNVIDFGAFVDIGVHQDGLVHISQMVKGRFIRHPMEVVSVGDVVDVKVINVDLKKKRIGLSMIL